MTTRFPSVLEDSLDSSGHWVNDYYYLDRQWGQSRVHHWTEAGRARQVRDDGVDTPQLLTCRLGQDC